MDRFTKNLILITLLAIVLIVIGECVVKDVNAQNSNSHLRLFERQVRAEENQAKALNSIVRELGKIESRLRK